MNQRCEPKVGVLDIKRILTNTYIMTFNYNSQNKNQPQYQELNSSSLIHVTNAKNMVIIKIKFLMDKWCAGLGLRDPKHFTNKCDEVFRCTSSGRNHLKRKEKEINKYTTTIIDAEDHAKDNTLSILLFIKKRKIVLIKIKLHMQFKKVCSMLRK